MTVVILGVDLNDTVGWAVTNARQPSIPIVGRFTMPKPRFEGDYAKRYTFLRNSLAQVIVTHSPQVMTVEAALTIGASRENSAHTVRLTHGYVAIAEQVADECDVPNIGQVHCDIVRQHFIGYRHGKSEALKAATMKQCRLLFGLTNIDHNIADAVAVWDWQTNKLRGDNAIKRKLVMHGEAGQ